MAVAPWVCCLITGEAGLSSERCRPIARSPAHSWKGLAEHFSSASGAVWQRAGQQPPEMPGAHFSGWWLAGPLLLLSLRTRSERSAIDALVDRLDPAAFQAAFGAPVSAVDQLVAAKTLTLSRLVEATGAADPTPFIYDSTMYAMAGLMAVGAAAHLCVRPVARRFFEKHD